ncbi:MAG: ASKHA domain-containing protein [bacterium]
MAEQYEITFIPDNKKAITKRGETLLDAALSVGVYIDSRCGGKGKCGKCRLAVKIGDAQQDESAKEHLSDDDIEKGIVLACVTEPVSNLIVEVPESSRLDDKGILISEDFEGERTPIEIPRGLEGVPITKKFHLKLPPPTLEDNSSDLRRVTHEIPRDDGFPQRPAISLELLKRMPEILREAEWDVTVTTCCMPEAPKIIDIEPGDHAERNYGIAVDIGTTTIAVDLVHINKGIVSASRGAYNAQIALGEDVITRIIHAAKEKNGLETLQKAVVNTINGLVTHLAAIRGIHPAEITAGSFGANSTMTQMFLGIDPSSIRREPWVPTANYFPLYRAADISLNIAEDAPLFFSPLVTGYMGGDITAGVLALGINEQAPMSLFIDMGTNGEIVLGNKEFLVSCSCSSGPAFEGVGVDCGIRAVGGAIERVEINTATDNIEFQTLGGERPRGICGSGLISAMASLQEAGILNRSGRFDPSAPTSRIREGKEGPEIVLARKGEAVGNRDIYLTEADIQNLIRSKAAIYAGCRVLLRKMGLTFNDIERCYIAGGFGSHLDMERSVAIGLLPDIKRDKFCFVGNTSLAGARMMLLSDKARAEAQAVAEKMAYIELSVDNDFMDEFTAAMFLPHTDLQQFPSAGQKD